MEVYAHIVVLDIKKAPPSVLKVNESELQFHELKVYIKIYKCESQLVVRHIKHLSCDKLIRLVA